MITRAGIDAETAATIRAARAAEPFSLAGRSSAAAPAAAAVRPASISEIVPAAPEHRGGLPPDFAGQQAVAQCRALQGGFAGQRLAADAHHQADRAVNL